MLTLVNRRTLLQGGAAAAGTLALGSGALAGTARPSPAPPKPLDGTLTAWVRVDPYQGARVQLAHFDRTGRLVGQGEAVEVAAPTRQPGATPVSAWGQTRRACTEAQDLARAAAARSWGVDPRDCLVEAGRIVHPGTARNVAYRAWVDIV